MNTRSIVVAFVAAAVLSAAADSVPASAKRLTATIDGDLSEWTGAPQVEFVVPPVNDLRPEFCALGWDDANLYVAFRVLDSKFVNANGLNRIGDGDSMELRVCPGEAARGSFLRLVVSPTSDRGVPALSLTRRRGKAAEKVASAYEGEESDVKWRVAKAAKSWTVEAAVPFSALGASPKVGAKLPFVIVCWDRDNADKDEWGTGWKKRLESSKQKNPPEQWPCVALGDENAVGVKKIGGGLGIARHDPCNMFRPDEDVEFALKPKFPAGAKGSVVCTVRDAYGREYLKCTRPYPAEGGAGALSLGRFPRGYWELDAVAEVKDSEGRPYSTTEHVTFGVMEQKNIALADFMAEGRRFGLKWWGGVSDKEECKRLVGALGLNWSRAIFKEAVMITTNTAINAIVKVERFPKELYDEEKYGPLAEWEKKFGRGGWTLKTLPKEKEYREYLREQIVSIPEGRNVFEIWNEPWDKLNPQDLTTLSGWISEELRRVRPGAVLGPNLKGDMSKYGYDAKVIEAGGMKGMDMVCLHPYSSCENRQWLRDYKAWISEKCGRPIDIYITEYGAHSCPQGPSRRSEREQSAMTVRQSLCLYAEDCKALVPHWIGQSERNPVYHEDWFGYVRKNLQPKPVLIALANCARLIDASEYRGDLWFGEGLGALLFAKDGKTVLALYGHGEPKEYSLKLPAERLTLVDTYGTERGIAAKDDAFSVKVGGEPVYLCGLPGDMKGDKALRADRFPPPPKPPRNVRRVAKMAKEPVFDGKLDDWKGTYEVAIQNEKVNGDDASGFGYIAWDDTFLYVAVDMRDNELLNTKPRATLYRHDGMELFVSTEPRDANAGYGPNDFQLMIVPTSGEGKPICGIVTDRAAGVVTDVAGAKIGVGKNPKGWTLECAVPWSAFGAFRPKPGARIALEPHVNDADTSHERWKLDPLDGNVKPENPTVWSIMEFTE